MQKKPKTGNTNPLQIKLNNPVRMQAGPCIPCTLNKPSLNQTRDSMLQGLHWKVLVSIHSLNKESD